MTPDVPVIMLVDDDADFLEACKHVLEANGYEVSCFFDPASALEEMASGNPDLVITDVMMDGLDSGFSLSRRIKEDPRLEGVPVIIVTAMSSQRGFDFKPHTSEDLSAMSADAYFDKPVKPDVLLAKVKELLKRGADENPK